MRILDLNIAAIGSDQLKLSVRGDRCQDASLFIVIIDRSPQRSIRVKVNNIEAPDLNAVDLEVLLSVQRESADLSVRDDSGLASACRDACER